MKKSRKILAGRVAKQRAEEQARRKEEKEQEKKWKEAKKAEKREEKILRAEWRRLGIDGLLREVRGLICPQGTISEFEFVWGLSKEIYHRWWREATYHDEYGSYKVDRFIIITLFLLDGEEVRVVFRNRRTDREGSLVSPSAETLREEVDVFVAEEFLA